MWCVSERRAENIYPYAEREKGKKQSIEEGASSGASGADDELLNTKDLNFFGDASVIKCVPTRWRDSQRVDSSCLYGTF